ncbi:PHP domain-containing protein [Vulgatibacter incomptus]|uniref:Putative metal-dependent phosphoesterase (PHP family) n=1 Tax=Vulgatibacter incomptus TaxID=1391653 RepID=A0A0K1PAZ9_9BACT|nr:PHP domain-containing protein [Vulgatibacter incomptus]AKU90682.1 putative metal-dependent phosphoesterase (PHP family) [Vulgatibacter incomptus]
MIDLHAHTTASDGSLSPGELVRRAVAAGVGVLAITDHDTVDGVAAASSAAATMGLRIVPGVEISCRLGARELHILGHFLDPQDPVLLGSLEGFRRVRESRARAMIDRLREAGLDLRYEELLAIPGADEGSLGRPHVARLLLTKGLVRDFQEAFDRWLVEGAPGWVERPLPEATEAIGLIRRAGGAASLAHPALSGVTGAELMQLASLGLAGLEVDHPRQGTEIRRSLRAIAASLGLVATAGSDFHGEGGRPGQETMSKADFRAYERAAGEPEASKR